MKTIKLKARLNATLSTGEAWTSTSAEHSLVDGMSGMSVVGIEEINFEPTPENAHVTSIAIWSEDGSIVKTFPISAPKT